MVRRGRRSASAPLDRVNSGQGSVWANIAAAMAVGLVVRVASRSGPAARMAPSPRLEAADASQRWRKAGGNARPSRGMTKLPEIYRHGDMSADAGPPHREFRS